MSLQFELHSQCPRNLVLRQIFVRRIFASGIPRSTMSQFLQALASHQSFKLKPQHNNYNFIVESFRLLNPYSTI